ncbi:MAG TPA: HNH endonuclease [Leptospiraceae bacterium]|nr:HNH endonuclease [Leptospiraceae bacterium]
MGKYYIKKLATQELGYRNGVPGGGGRYIYVSKKCADFFPHLSVTQLNDTVLIPVIPPFANTKVYTSFVYHNDKHILPDGSRDEYRLYLNKAIDPERKFYLPGDIIVFQKTEREEKGEMIPNYFLYRFEEGSANYKILDELVEASGIKGGHALVEASFDFLPEVPADIDTVEVIIPEEVKKEAAQRQEQILSEEEKQKEETVEVSATEELEQIRGAHLFNSVSFRDFVLLGYGYKCAITEKAIVWNQLNNLEAAHIKPKAHTGSFLPCNGIALSRDMHWAFDKGFITVSDDYRVVVHDEVKNTMLKEYDGKPLVVPADPFFKPDKNYLKHHRENVFGLFRHSGVIRNLS